MLSEVSFVTPYDIPTLLEQITSNGKTLQEGNEEARQACLTAARNLQFALEKPTESILRTRIAEVKHHPSSHIRLQSWPLTNLAASSRCCSTHRFRPGYLSEDG